MNLPSSTTHLRQALVLRKSFTRYVYLSLSHNPSCTIALQMVLFNLLSNRGTPKTQSNMHQSSTLDEDDIMGSLTFRLFGSLLSVPFVVSLASPSQADLKLSALSNSSFSSIAPSSLAIPLTGSFVEVFSSPWPESDFSSSWSWSVGEKRRNTYTSACPSITLFDWFYTSTVCVGAQQGHVSTGMFQTETLVEFN